jgi:hypothetical protein
MENFPTSWNRNILLSFPYHSNIHRGTGKAKFLLELTNGPKNMLVPLPEQKVVDYYYSLYLTWSVAIFLNFLYH